MSTLQKGGLGSLLILLALMVASGVSAQDAQRATTRDQLSLTVAASGGHFEGGQRSNEAHAFASLSLDARYYIQGQHGFALRGVTAGTLWGEGSAHTVEGRYSFRLATDPARTFGASLSFDGGLGVGELSATRGAGGCWWSCSNTPQEPRYTERYVPVYGVAAINGDIHLAAFTLGAEVGLRAGALPMTSHTGDAGPRILSQAFVSPYLGLHLGVAFGL